MSSAAPPFTCLCDVGNAAADGVACVISIITRLSIVVLPASSSRSLVNG